MAEAEQMWLEGKNWLTRMYANSIRISQWISPREIDCFLNSLDIDEYFLEFYERASQNGLDVVIVSDGFNLFIETISRTTLLRA